MKNQPSPVERREHPRFGVIAKLEDITYSILRKHALATRSDSIAVAVESTKD